MMICNANYEVAIQGYFAYTSNTGGVHAEIASQHRGVSFSTKYVTQKFSQTR